MGPRRGTDYPTLYNFCNKLNFSQHNLLAFSDGGSKPEEGCSASAWVIGLMVKGCGEQFPNGRYVPLLCQGIFLDSPSSSFKVEAIALDSLMGALCEICNNNHHYLLHLFSIVVDRNQALRICVSADSIHRGQWLLRISTHLDCTLALVHRDHRCHTDHPAD